MIPRSRMKGWAAMVLLPGIAFSACHKEEQVVQHVAQSAASAEKHAQAAATQRDQDRAQLARIPLPTKSLYMNVHDPSEWKNPFISVDANFLDLRVIMEDANPSTLGEGSMFRPEAARQQELQIRPGDLAKALLALPNRAWPYGRVVAIAESPEADRSKRPIIRRNVESAIQRLNDLGVVVEEWPSR